MTALYITYDYALFQQQCPIYNNPIKYPSVFVEQFWNVAIFYVSNYAWWGSIQGDKRAYAINLMTGHLIWLYNLALQGQVPGLMNSAHIDKIDVSLVAPPLRNQWQYFCSLSPYGQQLLALAQVNTATGFSVGGSPVRASFGVVNYYGYGWY